MQYGGRSIVPKDSLFGGLMRDLAPWGIAAVAVWAVAKNWDKINPFGSSQQSSSSSGGGDTTGSGYGGGQYIRNADGSAVYIGPDGSKIIFGGTSVAPSTEQTTIRVVSEPSNSQPDPTTGLYPNSQAGYAGTGTLSDPYISNNDSRLRDQGSIATSITPTPIGNIIVSTPAGSANSLRQQGFTEISRGVFSQVTTNSLGQTVQRIVET